MVLVSSERAYVFTFADFAICSFAVVLVIWNGHLSSKLGDIDYSSSYWWLNPLQKGSFCIENVFYDVFLFIFSEPFDLSKFKQAFIVYWFAFPMHNVFYVSMQVLSGINMGSNCGYHMWVTLRPLCNSYSITCKLKSIWTFGIFTTGYLFSCYNFVGCISWTAVLRVM